MSEEGRWNEYWKQLERQANAKEIPVEQYNAMLRLWKELNKTVGKLRRPSIEVSASDPNCYYFSWSFTDVPHEVITVDIDPKGQYDWFYWNSEDSNKIFEGMGNLNDLLKALAPSLKVFKRV